MTLRSRLVPAVLAVVIVVLAGTGIWTVGDRRGGGDETLDASMGAVVAELEAFVESARGLRFREPVNVAVLSDAAFRRALSGGEPVEQFDADVETGVLRALG